MNLERKLSEKLVKKALKWENGVYEPSKLLENKNYSVVRFYDARTVYSIRKKLEEKYPRLYYNGFKNHKPHITDCALQIKDSGGFTRDSLTGQKSYIPDRLEVKQDVWVGVNYEGKKEVISCFCFSELKDIYTPQKVFIPCMNSNIYGLTMKTIISVEDTLVSMNISTWNFLDENKIPFTTLENMLEKANNCTHLLYNYNFVWLGNTGYWDVFREPYKDYWYRKYEREDST